MLITNPELQDLSQHGGRVLPMGPSQCRYCEEIRDCYLETSEEQMALTVTLIPNQRVWTLKDSNPFGYAPDARTGCIWNAEGEVRQRSIIAGECYKVEIRTGDRPRTFSNAWYESCELAYWDEQQARWEPVVPGTEMVQPSDLCLHCGRAKCSPEHMDAEQLPGQQGHFFKPVESPEHPPARTAWDRIGEDF